jgi:putative ABC transport system ATP-binding protein/lipoprotein-releasing system ATP-binding protein
LDNIALNVLSGESVAVMGRSGSGKSSLLSCILGLVKPDSGEIMIDDQKVVSGRRSRMAKIRREKLGIVFQSGELLPELSSTENVLIAGLLAGQPIAQARERCAKLLEQLGIPAGTRTISEFSGGERQRVAVARALMNQPRLLLADEPTGSLDPQTRDQVIEMLFEVPATYGCALVVVTHDPVVAERAGECYWLEEGILSSMLEQEAGSR